jgi:uncharacterized protein YerC
MSNELKTETKAQVVSLLCEGNSIRSIERVTGIHRDTINHVQSAPMTASMERQRQGTQIVRRQSAVA